MAASRSLLSILGLSAVLTAGCDRAPTAPELDDVAALLSISNPTAAANSRILNNTLPALFREAVAKVEERHGRTGVEVLLADWRDHQQKLKKEAPTASRAAVQARLAAIHNEELRIVERVLGHRAVDRVIGEAAKTLADARTQLAAIEAAGEDMSAAKSVAENAGRKLEAARATAAAGDTRQALDMAAGSATLVAGLRYYLVEARRIDGIEVLFPMAAARLGDSREAAINRIETLNTQVRAAIQAGNRSGANALLARARAAQIEVVLQTLGTGAATNLLRQVEMRAAELTAAIAATQGARHSVKVERMLHEAKDMNARARVALKNGDAATALDLASHAAGLLNALQHLTWH